MIFSNTLKLKQNSHFSGFHMMILEKEKKSSVFILLSDLITFGKYFYLPIYMLHIHLQIQFY